MRARKGHLIRRVIAICVVSRVERLPLHGNLVCSGQPRRSFRILSARGSIACHFGRDGPWAPGCVHASPAAVERIPDRTTSSSSRIQPDPRGRA